MRKRLFFALMLATSCHVAYAQAPEWAVSYQDMGASLPPVPSVEWRSSNLTVTISKVAATGAGGKEFATVVAMKGVIPCSANRIYIAFDNQRQLPLHRIGNCFPDGSQDLSSDYSGDADFRSSSPFAIGVDDESIPIPKTGYQESSQVLASFSYP